MPDRKLQRNVCKDCFEYFYTFGKTKRQFCDKCKKAHAKASLKRYSDNGRRKEPEVISQNRSIKEIVAELEQYNKANGTHYTCGQYVQLMK